MTDFADLGAVYINTSLKKTAGESHAPPLTDASGRIIEKQGVAVRRIHLLGHEMPPGVHPDMTEHGWDRDDWPALWKSVSAAARQLRRAAKEESQ